VGSSGGQGRRGEEMVGFDSDQPRNRKGRWCRTSARAVQFAFCNRCPAVQMELKSFFRPFNFTLSINSYDYWELTLSDAMYKFWD
jgi:hypothetical protein